MIPDTLFLHVGHHGHLTARGINAAGQVVAAATPAWTTSNAAVATVRDTGVVTAIAVGHALITATIEGLNATARVTVFPPQPPPPPLTSFTMNGVVIGVEPGADTTRAVRVPNVDVALHRIAPATWSPAGPTGALNTPPLDEHVATRRAGSQGEFIFADLSPSWWYRVSVKAPAGSSYLDGSSVLPPAQWSVMSVTVILHQRP
jgi:hypothetical protein